MHAVARALASRRALRVPALSLKGFDDRVLSLYSRGMTVREIQGHLEELYKVEVSPDLLSQATHAVWEDIQAWRNRPLQAGGRPRLDTNSLRWMVSQAAKEAGLHKHLHPHLLRHTFASHCFQRGILRGRSSSG